MEPIQTVVAVITKNKKILMDKRRKDKTVYAGFLMCPSGHVEKDESFESAIKRELKEELEIDVENCKYLFSIIDVDPTSKKTFKHNFMLIKKYSKDIKKSNESRGLVWMGYDEIRILRLPSIVKELIKKLRDKNEL